jgi:hypothetical protein
MNVTRQATGPAAARGCRNQALTGWPAAPENVTSNASSGPYASGFQGANVGGAARSRASPIASSQ